MLFPSIRPSQLSRIVREPNQATGNCSSSTNWPSRKRSDLQIQNTSNVYCYITISSKWCPQDCPALLMLSIRFRFWLVKYIHNDMFCVNAKPDHIRATILLTALNEYCMCYCADRVEDYQWVLPPNGLSEHAMNHNMDQIES